MEKVAFADGEKIGVIGEDGVSFYESETIARYREYAETRQKNDEWKYSGEGARFRGDTAKNAAVQTDAYVNGVAWQDGKIVYAYTVGGSSGVCRRPQDPKAREEHIYSASDAEILSVQTLGPSVAVTVKRDEATSQVGILDGNTSELVTFTEGDARDANAAFDAAHPMWILFDSAGAGRLANGEFSGQYAPAVLMRLDRETLALEEVKRDGKNSCVKPKTDADGALYYIRRPNKERRDSVVWDILLFPFRLVKAFFGLLQAFTVIFGKTSLTSDMGTGNNPTSGRKQDARKLFVDGRLIDAEKEEKRNRKRKDHTYGFIPASWKLMKAADGADEVLASGVCDFSVGREGIYYTDGRHIYKLSGGKETKLADTKCCLSLCAEPSAEEFDF